MTDVDLFAGDISYLGLDVENKDLNDAINKAYHKLIDRNENSENMTRMFYHLFITRAKLLEHNGKTDPQILDDFLEHLGKIEEDGFFNPSENIGLECSEAIALNMVIAQIAFWVKDNDGSVH